MTVGVCICKCMASTTSEIGSHAQLEHVPLVVSASCTNALSVYVVHDGNLFVLIRCFGIIQAHTYTLLFAMHSFGHDVWS